MTATFSRSNSIEVLDRHSPGEALSEKMSVNKTPTAIDERLVGRLLATQFPEWAHLSIRRVARGGWDNRMIRLGDEMVVRLPSGPAYAAAIEREQRWLPFLAPRLRVAIPNPIAMGQPSGDFPWHWSIYRWICGDAVQDSEGIDLVELARAVGQFLSALQAIDAAGGPVPGPQNFYRGGSLSVYAEQTARAIDVLGNRVDLDAVQDIWQRAMASSWKGRPRWVHGDMSAGNLLVVNGELSGVIDFGQLALGDPASDLAIAWTVFDEGSRHVFSRALALDSGTWARARGWALWKALVLAARLVPSATAESEQCWRVIDQLMHDRASSEA